MLVANQNGLYEAMIQGGLRLADLPADEGGWREYFENTDEGNLEIEDPYMRASTALMLENTKRWLFEACGGRFDNEGRCTLDEATQTVLLGGFTNYLFPIIRAAFPTNPLNDLVSVQPTTQKIATVIYWNWIAGSTKGSIIKGQKLFDAITGPYGPVTDYTSENVVGEAAGAGDGATAVISGTLTYHDGGGIRAGSVNISATHSTAGAVTFSDTGNGTFVQSSGTGLTISSSSINYTTGVWSITVSAGNFTVAAVTATYAWDSEGSDSLPEYDIQLTSSATEAERRAIKLRYSREAIFDVMQQFGRSLEPDLVAAAAEQLNSEITRQVISDIWALAPVTGTFSIAAPTYYSQQDHFRDFVYYLNQSSNRIWGRTQLGYGNWLVVDEGAANVIESMPVSMFEKAPAVPNRRGVHFIGTLQGQYRVYKDLFLVNQSGASSYGNVLMGYKGQEFYDAGYVWAPYQMLYTTPPLTDANFLTRQGMASRYARKVVNANMYTRISMAA